MRSCDESFGASLFLSLPEDVLAVIARFISPRDLCNLILCCKSVCDVVDSESIWLAQCQAVKILPLAEIVYWGTGISSYKAICRFLVDVVKPLVGIWVHQRPEVGNVVYVRPCFLSVVGCRIIPQDIDPSGIQEGRFKWSPVFEIVCGLDGSAKFFLHGKDVKLNCCSLYPGFVRGIEKSCNVLLLEVEPRQENKFRSEIETELLKESEVRSPFHSLLINHRRELLDKVTCKIGIPVPDKNLTMLERRSMLHKMHKFGGDWNHMNLEDECTKIPNQVDRSELWKHLGFDSDFCNWDTGNQDNGNQDTQRKSVSRYFRNGIKHIVGRFTSSKNTYSSGNGINRRLDLQKFLSYGDSVGLSVKASNTKLSFNQGWPSMNQSCYALYRLPIRPFPNQEYAGLWGGTFGWPPGTCSEDKPVKPLFLLKLSYKESQDHGEKLLIGTKILESAHYAMHRNGSPMFVVKIDSPSFELFPFNTNGEDFEHSYAGEGIAKGSSFQYPTYKPGSLFVTSKGLIMFVWKATRVVLTLQRVNLGELFRKGICMRPLHPCLHFTSPFAPERRRY